MQASEVEKIYPTSTTDWRNWLIENHETQQSIWLVYYKKKTKKPSLTWSEAVDQALCFGWIDSVAKPIDDEIYMQFFSKRKPKSVWSKINKEKVKVLLAENLIMPAGLKCIEIAKENGSWAILDDVEEMIIPADLELALLTNSSAMEFFLSISNSVRKAILQWLIMAKRPETRNSRILEIAESAANNLKPRQFR